MFISLKVTASLYHYSSMKKVSLSLNLWISFSKSRFFCSRNPLACLLFPMQFLSMKVNEPLHRDLPCPTKLIHAVAHLCQTALLFLSGVWQSKKTQSGVVWVAMAVPELSFLAVPLSWYSSREILCRLIEVWSLLQSTALSGGQTLSPWWLKHPWK